MIPSARHPLPLFAALTLAASSLAVLPGCLEEDELGQALQKVSLQLQTLGAPGAALRGEQLRVQTYNEAIATLRPLTGKGSASQQANAWLLIARAELGLAADPATALTATHREIETYTGAIRADLSVYRDLLSHAAAAESFDPTAEITELQSSISDRTAAMQEVEQELAGVKTRIAEFESLAQTALDQAREFRETEASLREQAIKVSAQEGLPLSVQAAEQRDQADTLEAEAARRLAEADVLRPQIAEHEGEIDRLTQQRRLLEESIESLNAQLEATRREAVSYRSRASEIGATLVQAARDMEAVRSGSMTQTFDEAAAAYESASASAKKAFSHGGAEARLIAAEVAQSMGSVALAQMNTAQSIAASVREAIDAGASDESLAAVAAAAESQAEAARAQAMNLLTSARDELTSARNELASKGENLNTVKNRLDNIVAQINIVLGTPDTDDEADDATSAEDMFSADATDAEPNTDTNNDDE